jgi:D-glycero-alpha-D-manno-heptose-7-phosphate kinase
MITVRTPLRVTLGGGGTDLQSYYRNGGGFIFAMALNKYIYLNAHRPAFNTDVVLHGIDPDRAPSTAELNNHLLQSALQRHGLADRFEASTIGDVAGGTGLGSSSCFLVGLLNALHGLNGHTPDRQALAEEACDIEITSSSNGIGKQDQYMAAFGGLTTLDIAPDGQVKVGTVTLDPEIEAAFVAHTHIYYTGLRRDASAILKDQNSAMTAPVSAARTTVENSLDAIKDLGYRIRDAWIAGDLKGWGDMLHEHWVNKKAMSAKISWSHIDEIYEHVRSHYNVLGGKVIGAGGGGFLMLFTLDKGEALEAYMATQNMPRLDYRIDKAGSSVIAKAAT